MSARHAWQSLILPILEISAKDAAPCSRAASICSWFSRTYPLYPCSNVGSENSALSSDSPDGPAHTLTPRCSLTLRPARKDLVSGQHILIVTVSNMAVAARNGRIWQLDRTLYETPSTIRFRFHSTSTPRSLVGLPLCDARECLVPRQLMVAL